MRMCVYIYIYIRVYIWKPRVKCIVLEDQMEQKQESEMTTVPII